MSRKLHIEVFRYNPLDPASVPHIQSFYVEEYSSMTLFIACLLYTSDAADEL